MADRPAPTEEIEITSEMIEAGICQFLDLGLDEDIHATDPKDIVTWIYEAMMKARV